MSDLGTSGLDNRIRDLVADAPPAPTIDEHRLEESAMLRPNIQGPSDRNRWIVGGIAGLSVAAAVIALIFVTRPDYSEVPGVVTQSTTFVVDPMPVTISPASSSVPVSPPAVTPTTADQVTTAPALPPATTPAEPVTLTDQERASTVTAGPAGIAVQLADAQPEVVTETPALVAVRTLDGAIWVQFADPYAEGAEPSLGVVASGTRQVTPAALPVGITGAIRLHDAVTIADQPVVLIEERPVVCTSGNDCDGTLWVLRPQAGTAEVVTTMNMWESGWSQLSLTTNGIIVGDVSNGPVVAPFSAVIPGADVAPIDFSLFGLDDSYADCSTCPSSFRIDNTGRHVAWMERDDEGGTTISVAEVDGDGDGPVIVRVPLVGPGGLTCCESPEGDIVPLFGSIDIADVAIDPAAGAVTGRAVINRFGPTSDIASLWADLATGEATPATPGTWIAFGA